MADQTITTTQTVTVTRAAGDYWRSIYEIANGKYGPDQDGSTFAFLIELIAEDDSDADLEEKTETALTRMADLKAEADHQNVLYRGNDWGRFIQAATGPASLRTLHRITQHLAQREAN